MELVGERLERWLFWKPAAPPLAEPNAPLLASTPVFVTIHGYSPAAARQTRLADGGRKRGVVSWCHLKLNVWTMGNLFEEQNHPTLIYCVSLLFSRPMERN